MAILSYSVHGIDTRRVYPSAGVDFTGQFPDSRYEELVGGQCSVFSDSICSLNIIPRLGFGVALGKRQR